MSHSGRYFVPDGKSKPAIPETSFFYAGEQRKITAISLSKRLLLQ
jgi:hypothetical protein